MSNFAIDFSCPGAGPVLLSTGFSLLGQKSIAGVIIMAEKVLYRLCRSENENGTTWGIEAFVSVAKAEDISPDREAVGGLCALMNEEGLELVHMLDVITDFLP